MFQQTVNTYDDNIILSLKTMNFSLILNSGPRSMVSDQVRNEMESNKFRRVLQKENFQEKPEQVHLKPTFSVMLEVYLGYSAAIPGTLWDHLAFSPPQRLPWCSQNTSIQKSQAGFDENNWPHLSLLPTRYLHHMLQHTHLRLKTTVVRLNKFNSSAKPQEKIYIVFKEYVHFKT